MSNLSDFLKESKLEHTITVDGSGNCTTPGNMSITGSCTATDFNTPSLKALKENIELLEASALEIIEGTKIYSYNYINDLQKKMKIGPMADESAEAISGPDQNVVDHANTLGLLLKGVQELAEGLKGVNTRLDAIESAA